MSILVRPLTLRCLLSLVVTLNSLAGRIRFSCTLLINGLRVSSTRIDDLMPGFNESWVYDWVVDEAGEFSVVYNVDVDDDVFELNEVNNSDSLVLVSEKPFPVVMVIATVVVIGLVGVYIWRFGLPSWINRIN